MSLMISFRMSSGISSLVSNFRPPAEVPQRISRTGGIVPPSFSNLERAGPEGSAVGSGAEVRSVIGRPTEQRSVTLKGRLPFLSERGDPFLGVVGDEQAVLQFPFQRQPAGEGELDALEDRPLDQADGPGRPVGEGLRVLVDVGDEGLLR